MSSNGLDGFSLDARSCWAVEADSSGAIAVGTVARGARGCMIPRCSLYWIYLLW